MAPMILLAFTAPHTSLGNSLTPVVSNIFMEHSQETAMDTADHKCTKWLRYIDNNFVV
jgi:hypothetical protein